MRKYWSHAAMLLLGMSLMVGFYEGRRLVKNTAKALTAATSIGASAKRGRDRDRDDDEGLFEDGAEAGVPAADGEERGERKRRGRSRPVSTSAAPLDREAILSRADKVNVLRQRQRERLTAAGHVPSSAMIANTKPMIQPVIADPPLDTGHDEKK